jgi:hypothetical protein
MCHYAECRDAFLWADLSVESQSSTKSLLQGREVTLSWKTTTAFFFPVIRSTFLVLFSLFSFSSFGLKAAHKVAKRGEGETSIKQQVGFQ